jgi:hypothetical protein
MRQTLVRHPDFPCDAVREIAVEIARDRSLVRLHYDLSGTIAGLKLPSEAAPERTDELWKHTCFEFFARPEGGVAYAEFNFSPSTAWAAYAFDQVRTGMRDVEMAPPRISVTRTSDRSTMEVSLDACGLPDDPWAVALTAVIEETNGRRSYWALKHPAGKPDFHAADGFMLTV